MEPQYFDKTIAHNHRDKISYRYHVFDRHRFSSSVQNVKKVERKVYQVPRSRRARKIWKQRAVSIVKIIISDVGILPKSF